MTLLQWRRALPGLLVIALTLLFFRHLAFSELILARGDTYNYFYPYWDLRNAAFRAGELPLWTGDLFMGTPLLANPQLGAYYPLNWLTAPFRAPLAIKISILIHSALAGLGLLYLYRQVVGTALLPALVAALTYTFSGHLGAHVEQINQFQGLAWLPLLLALYHRALTSHSRLRDALLLSMALALQISCGHTQTVFISGIGLGLYGLGHCLTARRSRRGAAQALLKLAICALLAALLALPQLLPSLELAGLSNRGEGLGWAEATAFSLPPSALGRALLPSYEGQLFGEYNAYLGIIGLGLAFWGMLKGPRRKWIWIGIAAIGLALALGRSNPLYLLLAELPGFNLFRVPARFLALYSLAMALLAGMGIDALLEGEPKGPSPTDRRHATAIVLILAALVAATAFLLQPDHSLIFGGTALTRASFLPWLLALLALLIALRWRRRWMTILAAGCLLLELLLAGDNLPYNDLAPPDVYLDQRFTITQLLAYQAKETVPGRTLSISQRYFDPGDIVALRGTYDELGMAYAAQFHALDAVKNQLTLHPNLALTWGIPTIDGFGGGITPTVFYSQLTSLMLPEGAQRAVDGRLGDRLALPECRGACIPALRWLQLTDTRYLIIDKVYDIWHQNIAYDTGLADFWADVDAFAWTDADFDQARILHRDPLTLDIEALTAPHDLLLTITDEPGLNAILAGEHSIMAVTLVNSRDPERFLEAQPPPWQRAFANSIKVYRVPADNGRAYLAPTTRRLPDDWQSGESALQLLRESATDVIHGDIEERNLPAGETGQVDIVEYGHERVALRAQAPAPAWLILKDAHYPGWGATVNGQPQPIARANLLFRAVPVPAGSSDIVFTFQPQPWYTALYAGAALWVLAALTLFTLVLREWGVVNLWIWQLQRNINISLCSRWSLWLIILRRTRFASQVLEIHHSRERRERSGN